MQFKFDHSDLSLGFPFFILYILLGLCVCGIVYIVHKLLPIKLLSMNRIFSYDMTLICDFFGGVTLVASHYMLAPTLSSDTSLNVFVMCLIVMLSGTLSVLAGAIIHPMRAILLPFFDLCAVIILLQTYNDRLFSGLTLDNDATYIFLLFVTAFVVQLKETDNNAVCITAEMFTKSRFLHLVLFLSGFLALFSQINISSQNQPPLPCLNASPISMGNVIPAVIVATCCITNIGCYKCSVANKPVTDRNTWVRVALFIGALLALVLSYKHRNSTWYTGCLEHGHSPVPMLCDMNSLRGQSLHLPTVSAKHLVVVGHLYLSYMYHIYQLRLWIAQRQSTGTKHVLSQQMLCVMIICFAAVLATAVNKDTPCFAYAEKNPGSHRQHSQCMLWGIVLLVSLAVIVYFTGFIEKLQKTHSRWHMVSVLALFVLLSFPLLAIRMVYFVISFVLVSVVCAYRASLSCWAKTHSTL
jgi:hypothetical protein